MRHFKSFALLSALMLSGAAFAVDPADSTDVAITNGASDTIVAAPSATMAAGGKTGTSSLSWTTAAASPNPRKIVASVVGSDFKTNVMSLSVVAGAIAADGSLTGSGTAADALVLSPSNPSGDLITAIDAYDAGHTTVSYTASTAAAGFEDSTITVTFTITADGV
ncbi:hypothetical protein E7T09_20320 [Deinococcus sp. KSM4-11]|uniref:hypothetical protein n=1 Tax=Deinococcus sp. KSM4-11 TaxID=2568654 RepID=UPI0010A3E108|nr:hypothetical protein [Deinococcus sp. KSM4-11]THF84356.1 hypothetical protein E7T09_20320 [Deinococcus sp. KSM4-11]